MMKRIRQSALVGIILFALLSLSMKAFAQTPPPPAIHSVEIGVSRGETISADGRLHRFRIALSNPNSPNAPESRLVKGKTYYRASDGRWYLGPASVQLVDGKWPGLPVGWNLIKGNAGHPSWGQPNQKKINEADFFTGYEFSTTNPTIALTALGYELNVKGRRLKTGGQGPGEAQEEEWGSSFTNQSIDEISPSFEFSTTDNRKLLFVGGGDIAIKGTAAAGQRVDPDDSRESRPYHFTYEVKVQQGGSQAEILRPFVKTNGNPDPSNDREDGIIQKGDLATWKVDELKPDGTRKFPPGTYTVTLTVVAEQNGAGGTATATATAFLIEIVNPTPPTKVGTQDKIMTPATAANNNAGNEFTYSVANPGVLTLPVRLNVLPNTADVQSAFENKLRVRVSAIEDSHAPNANPRYVSLLWNHEFSAEEKTSGKAVYGTANQQWEVSGQFTGLPRQNTQFGRKTLTVDLINEANTIQSLTRDFEVFFPIRRTATDYTVMNHPFTAGSTTVQPYVPNWYYYWTQTAANYGVSGPITNPGTTHQYQDSDDRTGITLFASSVNRWIAYTRNPAAQSTGSGTWNNARGIDLFANIMRHEGQHRLDMIANWGATTGRVIAEDENEHGDFLKNTIEPTLTPPLEPAGSKYSPTNLETFLDHWNYGFPANQPIGDAEHYCLGRQPAWTNGHANNVDWSSPGMQHATENDPSD